MPASLAVSHVQGAVGENEGEAEDGQVTVAAGSPPVDRPGLRRGDRLWAHHSFDHIQSRGEVGDGHKGSRGKAVDV